MCPILGTFPESIRSYWDLDIIVMHMTTSHQSDLYLVNKKISKEKTRHTNNIVELVVAVERESNTIKNVESGGETRTNLTGG